MFATLLQIILANGKTYKNLVTCFLLLLYLFIATPVQVWHRHAGGFAAITGQQSGSDDLLSPCQASGGGSDCEICSHSYSVHAGTGPVSFNLQTCYHALQRPDLFLPPLEAVQCLFGNKGPPAPTRPV